MVRKRDELGGVSITSIRDRLEEDKVLNITGRMEGVNVFTIMSRQRDMVFM